MQKLFTHRQLHDAANFDEATTFARKGILGVRDDRFAQSGAEPGALATFARDGFFYWARGEDSVSDFCTACRFEFRSR